MNSDLIRYEENKMGMDLIGAKLHYNWAGWFWLIKKLQAWGVDTSEFGFFNDGDPICKETCQAVATAIETHLDELDQPDRDWIVSHIAAWRECNGCEQW